MTGCASDADGEGLFQTNLLPGIRSRNVAFQLLNGLRLTGDDPRHQVTNRDYSNHGVILHDGQMMKMALGHNGHSSTVFCGLTPGKHWYRGKLFAGGED
jgi:hypothetical protein